MKFITLNDGDNQEVEEKKGDKENMNDNEGKYKDLSSML